MRKFISQSKFQTLENVLDRTLAKLERTQRFVLRVIACKFVEKKFFQNVFDIVIEICK